MVNTIAKNTSASSSQVQTVLASYKNSISASAPSTTSSSSFKTQTINQIYQATGISREKVESVIKEVDRVANTPILNQQVATPAEIITNVCKETGIEKTKVITVIKEVAKVAVADKDTIKKIAEKENLKEEQVKKIISTQTPLVTEPEKHIEQTLSIPPSVSIEDYEEVKKMWTSQYEKGEVPVSENLSSREEWVDQDIVFITNTLNKLMSPDEKLKAQGVDDLGYILPIFLINNLKGEELAVYLKAKLEAAKHVKEMKEMERQITEKLKEKSKDDEELVELKKAKPKEEEKHFEAAQEMKIEDNKPKEDIAPSDTSSKPESDHSSQ